MPPDDEILGFHFTFESHYCSLYSYPPHDLRPSATGYLLLDRVVEGILFL